MRVLQSGFGKTILDIDSIDKLIRQILLSGDKYSRLMLINMPSINMLSCVLKEINVEDFINIMKDYEGNTGDIDLDYSLITDIFVEALQARDIVSKDDVIRILYSYEYDRLNYATRHRVNESSTRFFEYYGDHDPYDDGFTERCVGNIGCKICELDVERNIFKVGASSCYIPSGRYIFVVARKIENLSSCKHPRVIIEFEKYDNRNEYGYWKIYLDLGIMGTDYVRVFEKDITEVNGKIDIEYSGEQVLDLSSDNGFKLVLQSKKDIYDYPIIIGVRKIVVVCE